MEVGGENQGLAGRCSARCRGASMPGKHKAWPYCRPRVGAGSALIQAWRAVIPTFREFSVGLTIPNSR